MAAAAVANCAATSCSLSSSAKASSDVATAAATITTTAAANETGEDIANTRKDFNKTSSPMTNGESGQATRDGGLPPKQESGDVQPVRTQTATVEEQKAKEKSAKKLAKKKQPKQQSSKKASKKLEQQQQENKALLFDSPNGEQQQQLATKPRLLVEELKLFQNNHLLNQQDPILQLQQQLNGLIAGDDDVISSNQAHQRNSRSSKPFHQGKQAKSSAMTNGFVVNCVPPTSSSEVTPALQQSQQSNAQLSSAAVRNSIIFPYNIEENTFTIKKGVLLQQQIYEKFHQRLFSRWKKRYFILTTDYFVCFKRSSSKVGRSEMGKFLYKTALSDVAKISWSRPTKSDKGAIILYMNGQFNLSLWSKNDLDEWMFVINESVERNRIRRSCVLQNVAERVANDVKPSFDGHDIYVNITLSNSGSIEQGKQERLGADREANIANATTNDHCSNNVLALGEQDNDRSHTITKCTKGEPFEAITKFRSPLQISTDQAKHRGELKLSPDIDPQVDHKEESNEVRSSSLSKSSIDSSSGSGRAHLIEHERQVEATDRHKTSIEAKETDGVCASERTRKPVTINHSNVKNVDRAIERNHANGSVEGVPTDDSTKIGHLSAEADQTPKNLSLEDHKKPAGANDSSSSSKKVGEGNLKDQYRHDDNNNHRRGSDCTSNSSDASLIKKNQSNLVKSGSKRSNRHKESTKTSEESTTDETCNGSGSRNRRGVNNIRRNESSETEQCNRVACDIGESSMNDKGLQPKEIANPREPIENKVAAHLQRPMSNLIRRDDSWQSLMSLTRVGKVPPVSVQIAQRSLYAQHIMPDTNNGFRDRYQPQHSRAKEKHTINVESTVTPSRGPFLRQQSIQAPSRKLRPMLPLRQQAASFDVAPTSPMLTNQPQQHQMQFQQNTSSYQQRLLQLQLLNSNSNNVDYIRHNGDSSNDYQIYWPESTAYGYSSMRSNLKSAASEFSFIRPSPSTHGQSTLPHHSHLAGRFLVNQSTQQQQQQQQQQQAIRSSVTLSSAAPNGIQQSDSNNNDIRCLSLLSEQLAQQQQFLVNPTTGERLINQQALVGCAKDLMMVSELTPPMRELPLKPNKKRTLANDASSANGSSLPKSSSLTSSIACFFRRAFSRRSRKKKRRSKLAESCSSSLGAFEDGYSNIPMVPSAFSTGSKSVDGRKNVLNSGGNSAKASNLAQSQRMVDMIEAFTNKTLAAAAAAEQSNADSIAAAHFDLISRQQSDQQQQRLQSLNIDLNVTPKVSSQVKGQHQLKSVLNQFGSPLHKSNSISATMGLSLADANGRRTYLYDNEIAPGAAGVCGESPMLVRSTKVMSANLTPLMSRREASVVATAEQQQQFFVSPRSSRPDQLPRPSSIYGQPSMISSPMITREERNNFGVHRNSLHNHHFRDRNHSQGNEIRRHQMMKVPFLDTTREVAEEISSPTTESREHDYDQEAYQARRNQVEQSPYGRYPSAREKFDIISASPSSGRLQQKHPQAIVNPILQSPTMDTIYDNHPMLNASEMNQSYSLYDNHNHLLMERHRQSPSVQHYMSAEMQPISPMIIANESPSSSRHISTAQSYTPSHQRFSDAERSSAVDMMFIKKKQSAIVAPSTPSRNEHFGNDSNSMNSSPIIDRYRNHNQPPTNSQTPLQSRRIVNPQPQYQQSPLVSSQTRVLSKGDRIQATIIGDRGFGSGVDRFAQPVVNIAGAPGINLEPSLAASLLRGTNIDAYESSTFDRLNSSQSQSNSKTFLVSTRLSKSMAYSQSSSNNDNNSTSSSVACNESAVTGRRSSKDELSSSGSRSMNSSIGQRSLRRRRANLGTSSSQEEHQDESSDSDTHGNRRNNKSVNNEKYLHKKTPSSHESSHRKLKESADELS